MTAGSTRAHTFTGIFVHVICALHTQEKGKALKGERTERIPDKKRSSRTGICTGMLAQSLTICHVYRANGAKVFNTEANQNKLIRRMFALNLSMQFTPPIDMSVRSQLLK